MSADETVGSTQVEDKLAELQVNLSPDIPYRTATVFPTLEGWGVKREIKRKAKLINNVEARLAQMLNEGEEVLFVSRGVQSSFTEGYFMGAMWANYINQTVFVLTNLRLLMMHCTSKGIPKEPNWMLFYSEIAEFKSSWTGMVNLKLRDGKKYRYSGFPKADRKAMPSIFEEALESYRAAGFSPESTQSRENLCNECYQVVPKATLECEECGTTFWAPMELAVRSCIFPSWGDFLMGHTMLAIFEIFGWLVTVAISLAVIFGDNAGTAQAILVAILVVGFSHMCDGGLTYNVAKKGLHTRKRGTLDDDAELQTGEI